MKQLTAQDVLAQIHALPSLPTVVLDLLNSLNDDLVNTRTLAQKITQDQALTAKTLRLANSSFYGMAQQINTVNEAVTLLGLHTVSAIVTTAALMEAFEQGSKNALRLQAFWRHAIATALCARELAPHQQVNPEHAYVAGLLHDIGRLIFATRFQALFQATLSYQEAHDCHLLNAERAVLGLDHSSAGLALTQHWKFPSAIQQAVSGHHALQLDHTQPLTRVVMAANAVAHALDLSGETHDLVPVLPIGFWRHFGVADPVLFEIFKSTEKKFAIASQFLAI